MPPAMIDSPAGDSVGEGSARRCAAPREWSRRRAPAHHWTARWGTARALIFLRRSVTVFAGHDGDETVERLLRRTPGFGVLGDEELTVSDDRQSGRKAARAARRADGRRPSAAARSPRRCGAPIAA